MLVSSPKCATLSMHKCKISDYTSFTHITVMEKVWGVVGFLVKIVLLSKKHFKLLWAQPGLQRSSRTAILLDA